VPYESLHEVLSEAWYQRVERTPIGVAGGSLAGTAIARRPTPSLAFCPADRARWSELGLQPFLLNENAFSRRRPPLVVKSLRYDLELSLSWP
jgi:hypothetical protein